MQVAFFTDEEGARFAPDMLGSLVYVGGHGARGGARRRAPSTTAPGSATSSRGSATPGRCRVPRLRSPHCFVELHIEQGPILEDEGVEIGVVTGVQGISWTELTITGRVGARRHDADAAAPRPGSSPPRIMLRARLATAELGGTRWRPSAARRFPNLVNVVPATGTVHRRPAQHRRVDAARRRAARCDDVRRRVAADRRGDDRRRLDWRDSSRSSSTRR